MRIDNQMAQMLQARISSDINLIEGSVIKAKVLEQSQGSVKLQFRQQQIEAKLQGHMGNLQGKVVSFLVAGNNQNEVLLRPIPEETAQALSSSKISEGSVNSLLRQMGLDKDPKAMELISNMMKFGLPIDEKAITELLHTAEQMDTLTNLQDNEKVYIVRESMQDVMHNLKGQDIPRFVESALANTDSPIAKAVNLAVRSGIPSDKIAGALTSAETPTELALKLRELMPEADTLRISSEDRTSHATSDKTLSKTPFDRILISEDELTVDLKEVSKEVKAFMPKLSEETRANLKETLPKMAAFFKKYEIPNTLGNMKQMLEYVDKPQSFVKDLKTVSNFIKDNPDLFALKDGSKDMSKLTGELAKSLSDKNVQSALEKVFPDAGNREALQQKMDFLADMNRNLSFMPFPISPRTLKEEGFINLVDENGKGKVDYKKNLNIMIHVDTHHMGSVKVFCKLHQKKLNVRLSVREEDLRFFDSGIDVLKNKINELGYEVSDIEFIFDKRMTILDLPMDPDRPNYFLDMKV